MRGHRPELKAVDGGLLNAPPMPASLAKEMAAEWAAIAADLTGRGLLTSSMMGLLETYVATLWLAREYRKAFAEFGAVVRSKDGVLRPNPACSQLTKANDTIARLAYEMGISAAGRNLPSIKSQAKAADDAADPLAEFDI